MQENGAKKNLKRKMNKRKEKKNKQINGDIIINNNIRPIIMKLNIKKFK